MECYAAIEKDEAMPTWVNLEDITLREMSWTEKEKYRMISLVGRI